MSSDAHFGGDSTREPLEDVPAECYEALRHPHRLHLLKVLDSHDSPLTLPELTTAVVERAALDVSEGQARHDVRLSLVHNHLPRLAEYDIVDWDGETAALEEEPSIHPDDLAPLLETCNAENGDRLLETLVHPVRIRLCSILEERTGTVSLEQLASDLTACESGPLADADQAKVALHHTHLPAMADVGAIEYDVNSGLVRRSEQALPTIT